MESQPLRKTALLSATGLALFAGCLVFVFLLSNTLYRRFDLSSGKLYSLSDGSKRILRQLDEPIEVRAYFSKELPPQYAATRNYVKDLLEEYHSASKGKVRYQFVDFEKDDASKQEVVKEGVAPMQFNIIAKEKYEVREGYMGVVLQREDKKEVIPFVADTAGFEYDLTSRLVRLSRDRRKVIGMVASSGATSPAKLNPQLKELIERNYELREIDLNALKSATTAAADLSALVLLGPTQRLNDGDLYALDQFLLSGRPVALGLDTKKTDMRSFFTLPLYSGLPDLLAHYGVSVKDNFVLDAQSQKVSIQQQQGWLTFQNIIDYPPFVMATDLNRSHPITRDLDSLTFPFVSPLEAHARTASGTVQVLAQSSKMSWLKSSLSRAGYEDLGPMQDFRPAQSDPKGPFVLAAAIEDDFPSYFSTAAGAEHPLPKGVKASDFRASGKSRLLVAGTSHFADPEIGARSTGGVFLLNVIDWLALDSDLIAIRSKGGVYRPLREIPTTYKTLIRWGNIVGPALLAVLFGMFRFQRRRRLKARRTAAYGTSGAPKTQEPVYAAQNA